MGYATQEQAEAIFAAMKDRSVGMISSQLPLDAKALAAAHDALMKCDSETGSLISPTLLARIVRAYLAATGADALAVKALDNAEIRQAWKQHGGSQHGPHVETFTIPEAGFWMFIDALRSTLVPVKDESGVAAPIVWRVRPMPGFAWVYVEGDPERNPSIRDYERQAVYARPVPATPANPVAVTEEMVERAARGICVAKDLNPDCLHEITIGRGDHTDDAGRVYEYGWRKHCGVARGALEAAALPPVREGDGGWSAPDKWRAKFNLWFFRDLSDEQRLKLFSLFSLPVDEIGRVHSHQRKALDRCLPSAPSAEDR